MAEQYEKTDAHDLFLCLNKFIGDNSHSSNVELRWITEMAEPLHKLIREWKAGGMKSLKPEDRQALAAFRLAEIEEEQAKLDKAKDALESEAKKIKREAA